MKNTVLSLYDHTAIAVRPWAEAGFTCHCYDIQHDPAGRVERLPSGGEIHYHHLDLWVEANVKGLVRFRGQVAFMFAFPVCTDLAVSGRATFAAKAAADPDFQVRAAAHAMWCGDLGDALGCPWMAENPVSRLATLWRKPDYRFDPYQYGGWIPAGEADHPTWPEIIPPRDAYTKKTCLWTGEGFVMPPKRRVKPVSPGYSPMCRLSGNDPETKNVRSATPRGFARAVFEVNHPLTGAVLSPPA